jgi:ubiquinone/menaquinone biosynthesis C-methylase UbiE
MSRELFIQRLRDAFADNSIALHDNFVLRAGASRHTNQQHTNDAFSEKWQKYDQSEEKERLFQFQLDWYLRLYGFDTEGALASYLSTRNVIFDAGCGLGYKAAWFAKLAPHALVIGMDFSDAARQAAKSYPDCDNLFFIQGDIANTGLREGSVDYTSCDQVIMHTEDPVATFAELARVTARDGGEFACYFYSKKAPSARTA